MTILACTLQFTIKQLTPVLAGTFMALPFYLSWVYKFVVRLVFSVCVVFYSPPGTVYVLTVTVFSCRHSQCGCYSSYGVQYFPVLLVYKVWICCVPSGLDIPSIPSVLAVINLCYWVLWWSLCSPTSYFVVFRGSSCFVPCVITPSVESASAV